MNFKRLWLSSVFSVLFVFTQTAGLLHDEIHPFHEHTAECDIYEMLAQPTSSATPIVVEAVTLWSASTVLCLAIQTPKSLSLPAYQSRAPPAA